jgi:hypothetical protein
MATRAGLGYIGLQVLRCLMFSFLNHRNGLCCPSYQALQAKTGYSADNELVFLASTERMR